MKCKKHPKYKVLRAPAASCVCCCELWYAKKVSELETAELAADQAELEADRAQLLLQLAQSVIEGP